MEAKVFHTEAIVLKMTSYSEADLIVHFLTKDHGRLSAFAKSAKKSKKRFGNALDHFAVLTIEVASKAGSSFHHLRSVQAIHSYWKQRDSILEYAYICFFSEILGYFIPDQSPSEEYYYWFLHLLEQMNQVDVKDKESLALSYFLNLRMMMGVPFECHTCSSCLKKVQSEFLSFHSSTAELYCDECSQRRNEFIRCEAKSIQSLHEGMVISRQEEKRVRRIMLAWVQEYFSKTFESSIFLESL